jgi:hypothetical protein
MSKNVSFLTNRLLQFTLLFHIFGCIWIYLGFFDYGETQGWVNSQQDSYEFIRYGENKNTGALDVHLQKLTTYSSAIYFIVTTFTTVGYGDFYGNTMQERIFLLVA